MNFLALNTSKTKRIPWSEIEINATIKYFGRLETLPQTPSIKECEKVVKKYEVLNKRNPVQLRLFVDNRRRAKSRQEQY